MDFDTISFLYRLGYLYPKIEWYAEHGFINSNKYKQITGEAYVAPTTQATTTSTTN